MNYVQSLAGKNRFHPNMAYRKFVQQSRVHVKLLRELEDYNQIIGRYLDITFLLFLIIISYITYLLFLTEINILLNLLLINIYIYHIGSLVFVISSCTSITRFNLEMTKITIKLYNIFYQKCLLSPFQMEQVRDNLFFQVQNLKLKKKILNKL